MHFSFTIVFAVRSSEAVETFDGGGVFFGIPYLSSHEQCSVSGGCLVYPCRCFLAEDTSGKHVQIEFSVLQVTVVVLGYTGG